MKHHFWSEDNETKGADVTDSFLFIYDMIESKLEGKMQIADGDGAKRHRQRKFII